ncbi:MAG: peptidoglycan bridge formation glycyltransferase FemA/FemB family protein [Bacilli bacterium]|nr:peptidoglycan bridge formation glycyltransferase FemA/FemB family protein [Bacilli bacterium]
MILEEITKEEFDLFAKTLNCQNFFQCGAMKDFFDVNNQENYLIGLKDNGKLVAATLLVYRSTFLGKKMFEATKGFILDYNNLELIKIFTEKVYEFIKSKNGYRLLISPYIPVIERDTDANIVAGGFDNTKVLKYLEKIGYKDIGVGVQVKWDYVLDINKRTPEELLASFKPNTRNYINRTINKYKLECKDLTYDELAEFKKITEDTCQRRGFKDKTLDYYQKMYKAFKDDVVFKIVSLNCDTYINTLEEENKTLEAKINELSDGPSNKNKKEVMKNDIQNNLKKIEDTQALKEAHGNIIPLSGAMFMLYGREIIYLFSGSCDEYMNFCGQYRIQWEIIKHASLNHYERYNFFGIMDVFNKDGKDYGVYEFKKGFNGYVEELADVYEYGKGFKYFLYKMLKLIKK